MKFEKYFTPILYKSSIEWCLPVELKSSIEWCLPLELEFKTGQFLCW